MKKPNPRFSENQLQMLLCEADADRNGVLDTEEFVDYLLGRRSKVESVPVPLQGQSSLGGVLSDWRKAALEAHNNFRSQHGAPDLSWSDECYISAKRQADLCQARSSMFHANLEGPSGRHGQNIYWCSAPGTSAEQMVQAWYDEMVDPGYNFSCPGFSRGTGHFTQLVWKGTTSFAMALSEDGRFAVANYFPAGNVRGAFLNNVLPRKSPYTPERRSFAQPMVTPTSTTTLSKRGALSRHTVCMPARTSRNHYSTIAGLIPRPSGALVQQRRTTLSYASPRG